MALLFDANGELVDYTGGGNLNLTTNGTILMWVNATSDTARQTMFFNPNGATGEFSCAWRADQANDPFQFGLARATTTLQINANAGNFSAYALNKWLFIAWKWDSAGANGDQKQFMGSLTEVPAEPSSYATQTVGSGAVGATSTTVRLANHPTVTSRLFLGRVHFFAIWNRTLSDAEIKQQWGRPQKTSGCVLFNFPGHNGTGTQPDWSGNANSGTVTGATVADSAPAVSTWGADISWMQAAAASAVTQVALAATSTVTATITRFVSLFRAFAATSTGTAVLSRFASLFKTFAATATGTATIAIVAANLITLAATATGTATISLMNSFFRTFAATSTGTATIARFASYFRNFAATATGTATIVANALVAGLTQVSLAATATGTATIAKFMSLFRTFAATSTGTAAMSTVETVAAVVTGFFGGAGLGLLTGRGRSWRRRGQRWGRR